MICVNELQWEHREGMNHSAGLPREASGEKRSRVSKDDTQFCPVDQVGHTPARGEHVQKS